MTDLEYQFIKDSEDDKLVFIKKTIEENNDFLAKNMSVVILSLKYAVRNKSINVISYLINLNESLIYFVFNECFENNNNKLTENIKNVIKDKNIIDISSCALNNYAHTLKYLIDNNKIKRPDNAFFMKAIEYNSFDIIKYYLLQEDFDPTFNYNHAMYNSVHNEANIEIIEILFTNSLINKKLKKENPDKYTEIENKLLKHKISRF
jgi:hypothetical protein